MCGRAILYQFARRVLASGDSGPVYIVPRMPPVLVLARCVVCAEFMWVVQSVSNANVYSALRRVPTVRRMRPAYVHAPRAIRA